MHNYIFDFVSFILKNGTWIKSRKPCFFHVHREHQREMEAKDQGNHKDKNVFSK